MPVQHQVYERISLQTTSEWKRDPANRGKTISPAIRKVLVTSSSSGEQLAVSFRESIPLEELNWLVVSNIFYFHPYLGKWSNLTNIFQRGWNHQLVNCWWKIQTSLLPNIDCQRNWMLAFGLVNATPPQKHHHKHTPSAWRGGTLRNCLGIHNCLDRN